MSWTDVFPVLTDEQVDAYRIGSTPDDDAILGEWFSVRRTVNPEWHGIKHFCDNARGVGFR
mgnify:CR=1 FL=1